MSKSEPNTGYGIISYLGILIIVPLLDDDFKKSKYGKFHLNQALVLIIAVIAMGMAGHVFYFLPFVGWFLYVSFMSILSLVFLAFSIIGIVGAAQGKMNKIPIIGDFEILK